MFPTIFERDTEFTDWTAALAGWSTSATSFSGGDTLMRSDGTVAVDYRSMTVHNVQLNTTLNKMTAAGLHIQGPRDADELTAYQYQVSVYTNDPNLIPVLFVGVSVATPTNAAAGEIVTEPRWLKWPSSLNEKGNTLNASGIIALTKTDLVAADRAVAFGVGLLGGLSAPLATSQNVMSLSVRRLVAVEPVILDSRKL